MPRLQLIPRLAPVALLLSSTLAQNDTASISQTNTTSPNLNLCGNHIGDFNPDASINSTGSVNIHWDTLMMDPLQNDWTFTLTYNETRNNQEPYVKFTTLHDFQAYISAPNTSEARTCVSMFNGLNATSSSGGSYGCDGVLNDACTSVLRNVTFNEDCNLPTPSQAWTDSIKAACGAEIMSPGFSTTSKPVDLSNKTCSISHPPGSTSPNNYRTFPALGQGSLPDKSDTNGSDFTWYDIYTRQTVPFIVSAQLSSGVSETQVLCVAAKDIVEGGRVPAEKSAASPSWRDSGWMAITVSLVVGFVITLY